MDNSLYRFEQECNYFIRIEEQAYFYEFNESTEQIELKGLISMIFARVFAFFSDSYKVDERNELRHKLITFYSSRHEITEEPTQLPKKKAKEVLKHAAKTALHKTAALFKNHKPDAAPRKLEEIITHYFPEGDPLGVKKEPRIYDTNLTAEQQKDIAFIIATLGTTPVATLAFQKSLLEAAGERIKRVHPLQYFIAVFSDENLTKNMWSLTHESLRHFVWDRFITDMGRTFDEERSLKNLTEAQVIDFAKRVKVDSAPLIEFAHERKWDGFISHVIQAKNPKYL